MHLLQIQTAPAATTVARPDQTYLNSNVEGILSFLSAGNWSRTAEKSACKHLADSILNIFDRVRLACS